MSDKEKVVDRLLGKKAEGFFPITSICKDDLRGTFKGNKEALKKIDEMDEGDMTHLASKMADSYCNCCYWESLEAQFESRFLER